MQDVGVGTKPPRTAPDFVNPWEMGMKKSLPGGGSQQHRAECWVQLCLPLHTQVFWGSISSLSTSQVSVSGIFSGCLDRCWEAENHPDGCSCWVSVLCQGLGKPTVGRAHSGCWGSGCLCCVCCSCQGLGVSVSAVTLGDIRAVVTWGLPWVTA